MAEQAEKAEMARRTSGSGAMTVAEERTGRILVVDDEEILRRHTRRHLERVGYLCETAGSAAEAREALAAGQFDVVLCDIRMPGESGIELARHIAENHPDVSTVMISGLDDTDTAQEAIELGAVSYVIKPFERNELLINVANALNRRALLIENRRHRERLEELVELQANYDLLTGLANRPNVTRRLELMLDGSQPPVAVLFVGLDHFKVINNSLGHDAGDAILKGVAARLRQHVGERDMAARFGGDTFVVVLADPVDESAVLRWAEVLNEDLQRPYMIDGRELFCTASIGIVPDTGGYPSAESALRDADTALNQAKNGGRATIRVVDEAIRARARKRLDIETGLREAIELGKLSVYYQPQYSLQSGRLSGFEALVRWDHDSLGLVLPLEFIPVAEEAGLIVPMGRLVLERACDDLVALRAASGGDELTMSVNVSASQLTRGGIRHDVSEVLSERGLDGTSLCVELTESVLVDGATAALESLEGLQQMGVRISVDDFGTGYSSLSYIGRLPIDELKIDRSFVVEMDDTQGAALVRGIIGLAKALGRKVVAEGIETPEQLEWLRAEGCDGAQGYLLGRPAPASHVIDLAASGTSIEDQLA